MTRLQEWMGSVLFERCGLHRLASRELAALEDWVAGLMDQRPSSSRSPGDPSDWVVDSETGQRMVEEFVQTDVNAFVRRDFADWNLVVQFRLWCEADAEFVWVIENGRIATRAGRHPNPELELTIVGTDYVDMITGRFDGREAFSSGRLKVAGDLADAVRIVGLFEALP